MKIIKKPEIKPQTCEICGTIVKLRLKDLTSHPCEYRKEIWICPICKKRNIFYWSEE